MRASRNCSNSSMPTARSRLAGVRVHPERGPRHGTDRAREPCRARRAGLSLLHRQSRRSSRRAARIDRARLPLHQGAGGAVAQPGRRRLDRHPSGRFFRPARPLRHRSHRRPDRERMQRWSIFSITMSASGRAFCSRRRGRCARKRCRAWRRCGQNSARSDAPSRRKRAGAAAARLRQLARTGS